MGEVGLILNLTQDMLHREIDEIFREKLGCNVGIDLENKIQINFNKINYFNFFIRILKFREHLIDAPETKKCVEHFSFISVFIQNFVRN